VAMMARYEKSMDVGGVVNQYSTSRNQICPGSGSVCLVCE